MTLNLSAFKAYDVRGRIPDEINADLVYQVGRAYAAFIKPKRVCVGRDIRLTSEEFLAWQESIDRHGMAGLRTTRLQQYR